MRAIINRGMKWGTLNGVIMFNTDIMKKVNEYLKQGKAKLLLDSEDTLMYLLQD